ncbi:MULTISPECIES: hypothetical protein [Streptosporangium]|uniref:ANTAR domain-containing protein n=1 Tax=Streptosporangium brasiliense TaxID=47480 RepID=A0ABT9R3E4_9ACTN|nr:hypothetical protein [Streptosporangium brasiliense]MDP9863763.1 hypothetical protein [Streptosporangium brasiliense]
MAEASLIRTYADRDAERALFRTVHEVAVGYAGVEVSQVFDVLRRRLVGVPGLDDHGLRRIAEEISVGRDPSGL